MGKKRVIYHALCRCGNTRKKFFRRVVKSPAIEAEKWVFCLFQFSFSFLSHLILFVFSSHFLLFLSQREYPGRMGHMASICFRIGWKGRGEKCFLVLRSFSSHEPSQWQMKLKWFVEGELSKGKKKQLKKRNRTKRKFSKSTRNCVFFFFFRPHPLWERFAIHSCCSIITEKVSASVFCVINTRLLSRFYLENSLQK